MVTVDIPDSWHPEEIADGVTGSSDDSDIVVVTAVEKKRTSRSETKVE
ncbi:MAG: hypothetical protein ABI217_01750 [Chthoniobacterales bacterium]